MKSPCRKEVKGQTGAPRQPGVPAGRKLHEALHGHGSREKRWEVKGSKRASPGFTAAHIEAAGETVKWTHPQGGQQRKDKNVFKEVRKWGAVSEIFPGAPSRKCPPFIGGKGQGGDGLTSQAASQVNGERHEQADANTCLRS